MISLAFFLSTHLFVKTSMSLDKANDDQILFLLEKMWGWKEKEREAKILGRKRETERGTVMRLLEGLESIQILSTNHVEAGIQICTGQSFHSASTMSVIKSDKNSIFDTNSSLSYLTLCTVLNVRMLTELIAKGSAVLDARVTIQTQK